MGKTLYRFQTFNNSSAISFYNYDIYASTPDKFNDPYDGRFAYNSERVASFLDAENLTDELNSIFKSIDFSIEDSIELLCKNEEMTWAKGCLISCFAENGAMEMMWAHYANLGKGFALKYDYDDILKALREKNLQRKSGLGIHKVKYVRERTSFNIFLCRKIALMLAGKNNHENSYWIKHYASLFLEKNICWREEKEWRIVLLNEDEQSCSKSILRVKPIGVVLGENMDRISRYVICSIAKRRGIPVFEVEKSFENSTFGYAERKLSDNALDLYANYFGAKPYDLYIDNLLGD